MNAAHSSWQAPASSYYHQVQQLLSPSDVTLGLACIALLALWSLGISPSALFFHPKETLYGVVEMASFKLSNMSLVAVDWEHIGGGLRGEHEPDDDLHAMPEIVKSYNELKSRNDASGSRADGRFYPGLLNAAGNLCYLNATLQSMASTPSLLKYLRRATFLASTLQPPLPTPVASALLATLTALNTPSSSYPATPLRPAELARALAQSSARRMNLISNGDQQDAQELWGMLREAVEEEVARLDKAVHAHEDGGLAEILRPKKTNSVKREMKTTVVKDPYMLLVGQRVRCMVCGYTRDVRHTAEEFVGLSVPPIAGCSLDDLLQESFGKVDMISDYACRKCSLVATLDKLIAQRDRLAVVAPPVPKPLPDPLSQNAFSLPPDISTPKPEAMTKSRKDRRKKVQKLVDRVQASIAMADFEKELGEEIKVERVEGPAGKQVRFARAPDVLTLHLNRSTHYGRGGAIKNGCHVIFPEFFNLSPYCDQPTSSSSNSNPNPDESPPSQDLYRLSSVVQHLGSHNFGHYVAYRRRPRPHPLEASTPSEEESKYPKPEWYRISDETVEPTTLDDVLRANPFLLFYERVVGPEEAAETGTSRLVPRLVQSWTIGRGNGASQLGNGGNGTTKEFGDEGAG